MAATAKGSMPQAMQRGALMPATAVATIAMLRLVTMGRKFQKTRGIWPVMVETAYLACDPPTAPTPPFELAAIASAAVGEVSGRRRGAFQIAGGLADGEAVEIVFIAHVRAVLNGELRGGGGGVGCCVGSDQLLRGGEGHGVRGGFQLAFYYVHHAEVDGESD